MYLSPISATLSATLRRLVGIEPAARIAGIDGAEAAGARAHRAHQHDGGGAGVPALADVGALGFFAHGGEAVLAHGAAHEVVARAGRRRRLEPARLAGRGWSRSQPSPPRLLAVADRREALRRACISRRCARGRTALGRRRGMPLSRLMAARWNDTPHERSQLRVELRPAAPACPFQPAAACTSPSAGPARSHAAAAAAAESGRARSPRTVPGDSTPMPE